MIRLPYSRHQRAREAEAWGVPWPFRAQSIDLPLAVDDATFWTGLCDALGEALDSAVAVTPEYQEIDRGRRTWWAHTDRGGTVWVTVATPLVETILADLMALPEAPGD